LPFFVQLLLNFCNNTVKFYLLIMATVTCRIGLSALKGNKNVFILSKCKSVVETRIAGISSKVIRDLEPREKPKPWPYKEKGYSNFHNLYESTMKRFDENTVCITVEGPPAIGKSAFARQLAHDLDMVYFPMVTCDFAYVDDYGKDFRECDPLLPVAAQSIDEAKFNQDPKGPNSPSLAFQLQQLKLSQYIDSMAHVFNTGEGVVIERCFWTDHAWIEANVRNGYNNKTELKGYYTRRQQVEKFMHRPHLGIYLDASVDTVLKNLKKRGLGEEKTYHEKYLRDLEEIHKSQVLVEFEKYSELLVYDWNEPGDVEAVVEDIERMDWTNYNKHDDKIKLWRWLDEEDAAMERWEMTTNKGKFMAHLSNIPLLDCPRLYMSGNDSEELDKVRDSFPSLEYSEGFNPKFGDNVLWKSYWEEPRQRLSDYVTKMLIDRVPPPKPS